MHMLIKKGLECGLVISITKLSSWSSLKSSQTQLFGSDNENLLNATKLENTSDNENLPNATKCHLKLRLQLRLNLRQKTATKTTTTHTREIVSVTCLRLINVKCLSARANCMTRQSGTFFLTTIIYVL